MEDGSQWMKGRVEYIHSFALETWYDIKELQEVTPKTTFLKLDGSQVKALYSGCNAAQQYGGIVNEDEAVILNALEEELDNLITDQYGGEAFIKLSTRSPKDTITEFPNEKMMNELTKALEDSDSSDNGDTIAFCTASRRAMRCTSGEEMMKMLYGSSRVREDIMRVKDAGGYESFPLSCVVREWIPMSPSQEFRVFVKERKLTAISQYCYYQYFESLQTQRKEIEQRIREFWEPIADFWLQENMVIDLLVLEDRILIIEVNPYFGDTGACLFSWRGEDRNILLGEAPFELRILESPVEKPMRCLPSTWVKWIDEQQGRDPTLRYGATTATSSPPSPPPSSWCCICY